MPLTSWGEMWYNGPPEIVLTNTHGLNGLADSKDLKTLQDEANTKAAKAVTQAAAWNLTPSQLFLDAQEAVIGIPSDLLGQSTRTSASDILQHGNRMRGLGILLITLALLGTVIEYLTES